MQKERLDLLMDIYKEAKAYNSMDNIFEIYSEQIEKSSFDYQYLHSAGLIKLEEIKDSEKWEAVLTTRGVDKAEYHLSKKTVKTEEDEFKETLDLLWESINEQFLTKQEISDKIIAFVAQTKGFAHVKGNAFIKVTDMIMRAYEEGVTTGKTTGDF